jgi:hypothetical protein
MATVRCSSQPPPPQPPRRRRPLHCAMSFTCAICSHEGTHCEARVSKRPVFEQVAALYCHKRLTIGSSLELSRTGWRGVLVTSGRSSSSLLLSTTLTPPVRGAIAPAMVPERSERRLLHSKGCPKPREAATHASRQSLDSYHWSVSIYLTLRVFTYKHSTEANA